MDSFEAGALSKSVQSGQIVPYLLDLKPNDLVGPLAQFQAVTADRVGTQALVRAIAKASSSNRRNDATTDKVFGRWWPSLQAKLKQISPEESVLAKGHRKVKASTTKSERANQFDELIHDLEHFHSNPEGIFYIGNTLLQCEALFEQLAGAEAYIELVHDLMKEIDEDERKDMGVFDPIISVTKVSKLRRVLIGLRNNDLSVKPLG